jgi:hypothetical protein
MQTSIRTETRLKEFHELAAKTANTAIEYAVQAGEILLAVKKELPHGRFTPWVESLGFLELRQAQRYMAVASGKPYTIGGRIVKNDAASFLEVVAQEDSSDKWIPIAGHWYSFANDDSVFWVVPWDENETFFHISKFYMTGEISTQEDDFFEEASFYVGTKSPIPANSVNSRLQYLGLVNPGQAKWDRRKNPGIARPFGEPDDYFESMSDIAKSQVNTCEE